MSIKNVAVKKEEAVIASEEAVEELIVLDLYLKLTEINKGLVASFKAEADNDITEPRTMEQWAKAFSTQANRKY